MKRFGIIFLLLFFAVLPVLTLRAQAPGEILRAQYGAGTDWIDVTQRVGSLMRSNNGTFRVENATFGRDPAPGAAKVLRLDVREADGRTRQLEFREHRNVSLGGYEFANPDNRDRRYDGDNRGNPDNRDSRYNDGALQITRALYGVGNRVMDVTARLNAQIRGGQLRMPVINQTMGGDPARNKVKTLTVWYTLNGRAAQTVVNENGDLNLPGDNFGGDNRDDRGNRNNQGYGNQDNRGYDQTRPR